MAASPLPKGPAGTNGPRVARCQKSLVRGGEFLAARCRSQTGNSGQSAVAHVAFLSRPVCRGNLPRQSREDPCHLEIGEVDWDKSCQRKYCLEGASVGRVRQREMRVNVWSRLGLLRCRRWGRGCLGNLRRWHLHRRWFGGFFWWLRT